ncbi:MAG: hypothetical protein PHR00_02375 [Patescibacteria group bacterium]|nr:hypothetical protein [Patescibacteria group bacterium]
MVNKKNSVRTSKSVAKTASEALTNKTSSPTTKKLAAATLVNRKKTAKK